MPSGKTHDLVTYLLICPAYLVAMVLGAQPLEAGLVALGVLIGGLMFGPDLDIDSRQYYRWGIFRWIWWPYKAFLPHRSRLSHGIVLGTLVRIVYFLAVLSIVSGLLYGAAATVGVPKQVVDRFLTLMASLDWRVWCFIVVGLWIGAASHSLVDFLHSALKKFKI
ncbi:MAG: metal-binding protein [Acidobacteriota bacterium]|nr:metal-binding protein [Blastocatellia bacterium]MDW8411394.1 metal-binding protein [Acidobacteriota bacterium]